MKLFKGLVISAVVVAWFFFLFDTGFAKQADELKKLDQLADEALQFTLAERYGDSLKSLQQLESEMNRALSHPYLFSMDEVRMLQLSLSDAKGALEGEAIHGEEAVHAVMKFRFVLDAIGSSYQPLWADMEDRVMGAFHAFQDSARGEPASERGMEEAFRRFAKLYDVIYPSILLDFPAETVKNMDARVQLIETHIGNPQKRDELIAETDLLEADLRSLFSDVKEDEADPSLWWVIISTGGMILLALSYAGYRKYRGEKKRYEKKQND
ncbi:MAG: hypothetical protein CW346_10325 [Bacillaceae bacterium]|nr:hypothetical protein [Bacillaceae bacterium]